MVFCYQSFSISNFFINCSGKSSVIVQADGLGIEFAFCPFSFIYFKFEEYLENEVY